jgi:CheY-like chemotaxis protein
VISGRAELLLSQLLSDSPASRSIEQIGKAADRAATLTRQLLAFSRRQVLRPVVLDLDQVVSNMIPMLRSLLGENIELQLRLGAAPTLVAADEGQLGQVITNLVVNARDAMPNGGQVTIRTTTRMIAADVSLEHLNLRPGPYVVFEFTDTGHGMRPEIQARIFEPFFSTKGVGKGTGLGLSMVYGIIRQHEGGITVDSQEGRGSTFTIYLPPTLAASRSSGPPPDSRAIVTTGTETILLAEDHDDVRSVTRDILVASGYTVLEARNGPDAIQIAQAASGPIDLLVTDVVMPQLSGWELAKRLEESRPGLKVLYMSGHTDDALVRHGIFAAHVAFLSKPFRPEVLAQKVREVLDAPS